jgi:hypothetical protein
MGGIAGEVNGGSESGVRPGCGDERCGVVTWLPLTYYI